VENRGGVRPGAGRPRGARNKIRPITRVERLKREAKALAEAEAKAAAAVAAGTADPGKLGIKAAPVLETPAADYPNIVTPLDYMMAVVKDPNAHPLRRDTMAIAAAPFVHPKPAPAPADPKKNAAAMFGGVASAPKQIEGTVVEQQEAGDDWEALLAADAKPN